MQYGMGAAANATWGVAGCGKTGDASAAEELRREGHARKTRAVEHRSEETLRRFVGAAETVKSVALADAHCRGLKKRGKR